MLECVFIWYICIFFKTLNITGIYINIFEFQFAFGRSSFLGQHYYEFLWRAKIYFMFINN